MDYKSTLNLPKTDFPMKAGLAEQEPRRIANWDEKDLYNKILSKRDANHKYVLHDGPPYANGNIHMGTALNKILKDIIVKMKSGQGYYSPYIPGWDCHGLPIEHKVDKELGDKKASMSKNDIRKMCRDYAAKWLDVQRTSFKRLGIIGDWANPYITMDYKYESITLKEFYRVLKSGNLYKGSKPVYWCASCVTALAEAEVEYANHTSHSIFVKFPLSNDTLAKLGLKSAVNAVIWTTTPWTLPANLAISLSPLEEYSVMCVDEINPDVAQNLTLGELLLVAKPIAEDPENALMKKLNIASWHSVRTIPSQDFERLAARHPFYNQESLFILGDHVLMTDGTGLVHTAPAHGTEDYIVGNKYGLEVYNPVDDYGKFLKGVEIFGGMKITDANPKIVQLLKENGTLINSSKLVHSYPHCWRCKEPVIYRATPQWFISMDENGLRDKALNAIKNEVKWIPEWGANRIRSMVEGRPDWCISRQRTWGVPIALFTCRECNGIIFNDEIEQKVLDSFVKSGADAWFEHNVEYYLGKDAKCPHCGHDKIRQEMDILDVWFDSGTSHAAVCEVRPEIGGRADMYLEGTDQHRGWFQSSLLESIATRGVAPYKDVLTHGFIIDGDMKKMSKSVGNVILPEELVAANGAEIIRLWVSSEDYNGDIRLSSDIIKRQVESYRKIRNTVRYLLGNLYDFNPATDSVAYDDMMDLDKYILNVWEDTIKRIYAGYENYQFHIFYHTFLNFCINDLSALYLDVIKDRVYSYAPTSRERRSAQTAMFHLAKEMSIIISPVLSFTADEVWEYLPSWAGKSEFVFEELFPKVGRYNDSDLMKKMSRLLDIRKVATKALEMSRADKVIGHSLDANILIGVKGDMPAIDEGLSRFFIVSKATVKPFDVVQAEEGGYVAEEQPDVVVFVSASTAEKCARCWTKDLSVGSNQTQPDLCDRCSTVLGEMA